jgi:hypothetical protein
VLMMKRRLLDGALYSQLPIVSLWSDAVGLIVLNWYGSVLCPACTPKPRGKSPPYHSSQNIKGRAAECEMRLVNGSELPSGRRIFFLERRLTFIQLSSKAGRYTT